jgi:hypothetical protein
MNLCGAGNKPIDSAKTKKSKDRKQRKKDKLKNSESVDELNSYMAIDQE